MFAFRALTNHYSISRYLSQGNADDDRVAALEKVFDDLVTSSRGDTRDVLSTETTIEYLQSLDVDLETAELFVVMELVKAPAVGEIHRQGFIDGWKATELTTFTKSAQKKHIRELINNLASDRAYFKRVYRHSFIAGKEAIHKALSVSDAKVYWKLLFAPPGFNWKTAKHDWADLWVQYVEEKWARSVSKDMWNMSLEFAYKVMDDEDLTFYSDQDAWPGVIDDFVVWYRKLYPLPEAKAPSTADAMDES